MNNINKEIERKFLLKNKGIEAYIFSKPRKELFIEQFYIEITEEKEVRYRRIMQSGQPNKYFKTTKTGSGLSRTEIEVEVDLVEYESFILASSVILNKVRYIVDNLEFDFYSNGLRILEKEYPTEKEAKEDVIDLPFIDKEVTGDSFYSNAQIALRNSKKDL